ncbi:MAG: hypothetical protein ACREQ8_14835, partial [Woeseiaceae bacterium]
MTVSSLERGALLRHAEAGAGVLLGWTRRLERGEVSEREEVVVAQESETRLPPEWALRLEPFLRAPELYVEPDL